MSPLSMVVEIWNWAFLFSRKALGVHFSMTLPLTSQQAKFWFNCARQLNHEKNIPTFFAVQEKKKKKKNFTHYSALYLLVLVPDLVLSQVF